MNENIDLTLPSLDPNAISYSISDLIELQNKNIDYGKPLCYSKIRDVKSPQFGTDGSAGFDVFIPNEIEEVVFHPNQSVKVPTGLKFNIPKNHVLIFFNKSGIASKKSLVLGACVIDSDYQGEVIVNLHNIGTEVVSLLGGDPIAQLIMYELPKVRLTELNIESLYSSVTDRGDGGFGSTFEVKG